MTYTSRTFHASRDNITKLIGWFHSEKTKIMKKWKKRCHLFSNLLCAKRKMFKSPPPRYDPQFLSTAAFPLFFRRPQTDSNLFFTKPRVTLTRKQLNHEGVGWVFVFRQPILLSKVDIWLTTISYSQLEKWYHIFLARNKTPLHLIHKTSIST